MLKRIKCSFSHSKLEGCRSGCDCSCLREASCTRPDRGLVTRGGWLVTGHGGIVGVHLAGRVIACQGGGGVIWALGKVVYVDRGWRVVAIDLWRVVSVDWRVVGVYRRIVNIHRSWVIVTVLRLVRLITTPDVLRLVRLVSAPVV